MKQRGFTLIELMITVAIIGILAAIALPNYTAYVQRGWRADARVVLLDNAQFMARTYSQNLDYTIAGAQPTLPSTFSPNTGVASDAKYNIAVNAVQATAAAVSSYVLTATPNGWVDSVCGDLTINQLGVKSASVPTTAQGRADCWLR